MLIRKNDNKRYNIKLVANILNIKYTNNIDTSKQIYKFLLKRSELNNNVREFIKKFNPNTKDFYDLLINNLYDLFTIKKLENINNISNTYYKNLIKKYKDGKLTIIEYQILQNELHLKLCKCIKKIYVKNIIKKDFLGEKTNINPYPICLQSIYKNRNIEVPYKSIYKCRKDFDWYKNTSL